MALGTPVAGAAAYSANNGTSVAPAYPAGILATDAVLLFVGQKPSTANAGTVTTPTGWTLREERPTSGGYGTTLGVDTGNTNLRVYSWDTPVSGQTGNLTVTLGTNNISWAFIVRIPSGGGALSYGSADGQRTQTPTSPMSIALFNGTSATDFQTGDIAIWAMCIPTDITTPNQFSAQSITATGVTFGTATELNEPDSATGNDIGGYSAWASVTAGSSTTAPTVTVTLAGTLTNVRGPVVLLRVREAPAAQTLTPSLFTNTQTFHNPTITTSATVAPSLFTNNQTFFSPTVTAGGATQALTASLFTNTQAFFAPTATATYSLTPGKYDNAQTFFSATVTATRTLTPGLYTNDQTFFAPTVSTTYSLTPSLYTNDQAFYAPAVNASNALAPGLYTNDQTFYAPAVTTFVALAPALYSNAQTFYAAAITQTGGPQPLLPDLYANAQTFYSPTVAPGAIDLAPALYTNAQAFFAPTVNATKTLTPGLFTNEQTFYSPTAAATYSLTPTRYDNDQTFYAATVAATNNLAPNRYDNAQTFYGPTVGRGAVTLQPSRYDNVQTFYAPTVTPGAADLQPGLVTNDQVFYEAVISQVGGLQTLLPDLVTNDQTFYAATVAPGVVVLAPQGYVDDGYVDPGYIGPNTFSTQIFYAPTVSIGQAANENNFGGFIVNVGRMMGR